MRKISFAMVFIAVLSFGCQDKGQLETTSLYFYTPYQEAPEHLYGKLISVKEVNYWTIEKDGLLIRGNQVTQKDCDSLGISSDYTAYFNEAGIPEKVDYMTYDWKVNTWKIEINENLIRKASFYRGDTVRSYQLVEYDTNKRMTDAAAYWAHNDSLRYKVKFESGEKGEIEKVSYYNPTGTVLGVSYYKWNDKMQIVSTEFRNGKDSLLRSSTAVYGENGFFSKIEYFDGTGAMENTLEMAYKTFDEKGNWLTGILSIKGKPIIFSTREYAYY